MRWGAAHQLLYSFSVGTAKKYSTYVSKCTCFEFGQMIKKVSLVCYYIDGIGSEIDLSALLVLPACMRHHEYLTRWMLSMSQPGALNMVSNGDELTIVAPFGTSSSSAFAIVTPLSGSMPISFFCRRRSSHQCLCCSAAAAAAAAAKQAAGLRAQSLHLFLVEVGEVLPGQDEEPAPAGAPCQLVT